MKQSKISEALSAADLFGDLPVAAVKKAFGYGGMSVSDIARRDLFIREFTGRAIKYLEDGIKSGMITLKPTTSQPATPNYAPSQGGYSSVKMNAPTGVNIPKTTVTPTTTATPGQSASEPKPGSPEYFAAKRAAAALRAQASMVPVNKSNQPQQTPKPGSPEYFAAKRAAAAQAAQAGMTPAPAKPQPVTPQPGEKAFGQMAGDLEKMANQPKVTTLPPGSRQLGPKGRATLARLGKQKQDRTSGAQQSLDLNESILNEAQTISQALTDFVYPYAKINQSNLSSDAKIALAKIMQQVELSYARDKGKSALQNLALAAWTAKQMQTQATDQKEKEPVAPELDFRELEKIIQKLPKPYKQNLYTHITNKPTTTTEKPKAEPKKTATDEPMSIGGQKLNPKDPEQAKIIDKIKQQQGSPGKGIMDIAAQAPKSKNLSMTPNAIRKRKARAAIKAGIEAAKAKPKEKEVPAAFK